RTDSAACAQRHEGFGRDLTKEPRIGCPAGSCCLDVEQDQLVDPLLIEDAHDVHGVTQVAVVAELLRLDETAVPQQQNGDDPRSKPHSLPMAANWRRRAMPKRWLFSGWNCVPTMDPRPTAAQTGWP